MNRLEQQYAKQVNEINQYYRKRKVRKLIILSILTIVSVLLCIFGWKLIKTEAENFLITWILFFSGLVSAPLFAREFLYSISRRSRAHKKALEHLHFEYQSQRLARGNDDYEA